MKQARPGPAPLDLDALAEQGWVLVAAHPDDETIGAGGLLIEHPGAGVVHLTDGAPADPALWSPRAPASREGYAALRRREALEALAVAGVPASAVRCLGVRDQEATRQLSRLVRELARLLDERRPALVVTHAFEGGHPDHDATALAVRAAAARLRGAAPVLVEMTAYQRGAGPLTLQRFHGGGEEQVRPLGPEARRRKEAMLGLYESQREVLAPFAAGEERFRRAEPVDFSRRPHPGPLHYEWLGWRTFDSWWREASQGLRALSLPNAPWP
ncbi:PIG-L deacetylase family protein [Anaeromyxobacter paludicola]|uniref:PIG-L deacetylase family protein n=1 Tax=Anaeromyxobacter paludicola TaxID=2918171 RepID=UPI0020C0E549|nr:PIG-L family deacetylase [Anaeromyxobacter paludicola]